MKKKDVLSLENRRSIYSLIKKYPGLNPAKISKKLKIPRTTINYHLHYLEKRDIIRIEKDGLYKRYFVRDHIGKNNKLIIKSLRKETACKMILFMMAYGIASQAELSKELNIKPSSVFFHLKKLKELDLIEEIQKNKKEFFETKAEKVIIRKSPPREVVYRLKNPDKIYDVFLTYDKSLLEVSLYKSIFSHIKYYISEGFPKKRVSPDEALEDLIEKFFEVFPHPYHI